MGSFLDLIRDNDSVAGVAVTTGVIVAIVAVLRLLLTPLVRRRYREDAYRRYWAGKIVGYLLVTIGIVALIAVWAPLGGRLSVILGFATAGIAFAMQEVIGALFGWVNIVAGRIYTVGDRIELAGTRGDVMDITPLRTTLMEIGAPGQVAVPVTARQPTGRVVTLSNRKTFTDPVFNYSAHFDWIWDEITFTVPFEADWRAADRILGEEVGRLTADARARGEEALAALADRYLLARPDTGSATFLEIGESAIEITARFVANLRAARSTKDAITRAVLGRFEEAGIPAAYPTYAIRPAGGRGHPGAGPPT